MAVLDLSLNYGGNSHAMAINDVGQVVGYADVENDWGDTYNHAFIWDSAQPIDLHDGWPANTSYAISVNRYCQVVGGSWTIADPIPAWFPPQDAFYCVDPLGNPVLFDLDKNVNSIARGINDAGAIVGQQQKPGAWWQAIYWPSYCHAPVELATTHFEGLGSKAAAINSTGKIVGRADFDEDGDFVGCMWRTYMDIDPYRLEPPSGFSQSYAWAINDSDRVVGIYVPGMVVKGQNPVDSGDRHACLWLSPYQPAIPLFLTQDFPTLPKSFAWDINNKDEIVGTFFVPTLDPKVDPYKGQRAFYSSPSVTTQDLNSFIGNDPALSGWALKVARGINNKGQIVGDVFYASGAQAGLTHAFLLTL